MMFLVLWSANSITEDKKKSGNKRREREGEMEGGREREGEGGKEGGMERERAGGREGERGRERERALQLPQLLLLLLLLLLYPSSSPSRDPGADDEAPLNSPLFQAADWRGRPRAGADPPPGAVVRQLLRSAPAHGAAAVRQRDREFGAARLTLCVFVGFLLCVPGWGGHTSHVCSFIQEIIDQTWKPVNEPT